VTNRYRHPLVRSEKRAGAHLAMLHLACGLIAWRAANRRRLAESALRSIREHRAEPAPSAMSSGELGRADLYGEANSIGSVIAEATTG